MSSKRNALKLSTQAVALIGVSTAMVLVATLLGFSSGPFYFNLGDSVILIVSAMLGPISAMIAGGLGAFFADMIVFPATMLYTLVIKAIEGLISGIIVKLIFKCFSKKQQPLTKRLEIAQGFCVFFTFILSSFIMALGYFICQSFMYGTQQSALVALPMDIAQASISSVVAILVLFPLKLLRLRNNVKLHL